MSIHKITEDQLLDTKTHRKLFLEKKVSCSNCLLNGVCLTRHGIYKTLVNSPIIKHYGQDREDFYLVAASKCNSFKSMTV